MTAAIDMALLRMLSIQKEEQNTEQVLVQVVRNQPKPEKAPIRLKPKLVEQFPKAGTLDAKGFMQAMRNAGKRPNKHGVMMTDPSLVRNDQIQAIASYIGYDPMGSFGGQEAAARAKANRELSGQPIQGMTRAERRVWERSMVGRAPDLLPDHHQRSLAHLQARETESVENLIEHFKAARDRSRSINERRLSIGMARIEQERLATIREDIARMVNA